MVDSKQEIERIYEEWDKALASNDFNALMALYAPDAVVESPLICHLMGTEKGICKSHKEIRPFVEKAFKQKPALRKHYRKGFFTDGKTIIWEYPRLTPEGDQMDFVEVMEVKNGLIAYHRIYWGWLGFKVLKENAYHR